MKGFFAGPAEAEGGEGYADLGDREEAFGVFEKVERGFGAGVAFIGELLEAGFAATEKRRFGGGEESVPADNQSDQQFGH